MSPPQIVEADLTWTGETFEAGVQVEILADGRLGRVGRLSGVSTRRLTGRALAPGFVNAHSHAFQRRMRGRAERFPRGAGDFWSWRQAMYQLVEQLDPEQFLLTATRTFREMRLAGITTVGEFHYLHHDGTLDFAFDRLVAQAARDADIRLVMLSAFYRTGGIGEPLAPAQQRFATPSPKDYWASVEALEAVLDPSRATVGAVVHSVRAASLEDLAAIHHESLRRGLVFHVHMEEQRREVDDSLAAYGKRPIRVIMDTVGEMTNLTAVHCTHTLAADQEAFLARGGRICLCPVTEANLGDGIPELSAAPAGRLCLGTDGNSRLDMLEEARWLEYGQRLRLERRGAIRDADGSVAPDLFGIATAGGADALGIPTGRLAPGQWADLLTIDLGHPSLEGAEPDTLMDTWLFGAGADTISATCVGGRWWEPGS